MQYILGLAQSVCFVLWPGIKFHNKNYVDDNYLNKSSLFGPRNAS